MDLSYVHCELCPRRCGVDRTKKTGYCGGGDSAAVAETMLHMWEEPCISGTLGSGAVFFSGCNLRCSFCQNRDISRAVTGDSMTADRLADEFRALVKRGAHNINLVTATPYLPTVVCALGNFKKTDPLVTVVYNTGGYERTEAIAALDGLVDVYLPDFKYFDGNLAAEYSAAPDYPSVVISTIDEMTERVGEIVIENGLVKRGVIIRHLVLPGHRDDSIAVLRTIADRWGNKVKVSIMRQFTPEFASEDCDLKRRVTSFEYSEILREAEKLGLDGYSQDRASASADYTPNFIKSTIVKNQ